MSDATAPTRGRRAKFWIAAVVVLFAGLGLLLDAGSNSTPGEDEEPVRRAPRAVVPAATTSLPAAQPASPPVFAGEVELTIEIRENEGFPVVYGTTNLPDGTWLMVTVQDAPPVQVGQCLHRTHQPLIETADCPPATFPGKESAAHLSHHLSPQTRTTSKATRCEIRGKGHGFCPHAMS